MSATVAERPHVRAAVHPWLRAPLRLALSLIALSLVAGPILIALALHENGLELAAQQPTAAVFLPRAELARWRAAAAGLPATAPPVVLAYHDVRPPSRRHRAPGTSDVTPAQLDEQLTMLRSAGYRALTAAQYETFLAGGPLPPRSVLLTFDGAGQGLWAYADPILARHRAAALAFLNPAAVRAHWKRELSWAEIARMQASARWSFGPGIPGASTAAAELAASARALAIHQVRPVRLLELSPQGSRGSTPAPAPAPASGAERAAALAAPFLAAFADSAAAPQSSRRAAAGGLIGRIDVRGDTSPDRLLAEVIAATEVPVAGADPLAHPGAWAPAGDSRIAISGRALRLAGGGSYSAAAFAPSATSDWSGYTVDAVVGGLQRPGVRAGILVVRAGGRGTVALRVGERSAAVLGPPGTRLTLEHSRLASSGAHRVRILVRARDTVFTIDDLLSLDVPAAAGPVSAGGIALASVRAGTGAAQPSFSRLTVAPLASLPRPPVVLAPLRPAGRLPLRRPALWLSSSLRRAPLTAAGGALRFTGAARRAYAAFAPARTRTWLGYAASVEVGGLAPRGVAALYARVGSPGEVVATVGRHWIRVIAGTGSRRRVIVSLPLPDAGGHALSMSVLAARTIVRVDGRVIARAAAPAGARGGIALAARRPSAEPWPGFADLTVARST